MGGLDVLSEDVKFSEIPSFVGTISLSSVLRAL